MTFVTIPPMKPGHIYENIKVLQAPMCSTTDLPFRLIARRLGLRFAFTEMLTAKPILMGCDKTLEYIRTNEEDRPLGTQVLGRDPDLMAEAFAYLESLNLFDVIDINMGCPVNKVVSKGLGAALMKEPKQVGLMLSKITSTVKTPVTVKFRTGWDFDSINAVEIAKIAEDSGACAITVHGRTRSQMYSGPIDFETIRKVKESVSIPVIGNGNLFSKAGCDEMLEKTGCDLVMISRGSNGNPWIFEDVQSGQEKHNAEHLEAVKKIVLEHARLVNEHYGHPKAGILLRRVGSYYFRGFVDNAKFKSIIHKTTTYEEFAAAVEDYTQDLAARGHIRAATFHQANDEAPDSGCVA